MRKFKLYIFLLILLYSCTNESKYPIIEEIYENGEKVTITYINDSSYIVAQHYDNGKIKTIVSKDKNNFKDGEYILYYPSGMLQTKGNYKKDKEYGAWYYYSEDGCLMEQSEYLYMFKNNDSRLNKNVYYNQDMSIDTTKQNLYFTTQSIQDTIYFGEPYLLNVKLYTPYFPNGMDIVLVDDIYEFFEIEKNKGFKKRIECKGFEHTLSFRDYHIGNNELKGIIINYNATKTSAIPYYFSQSFYVKELPGNG